MTETSTSVGVFLCSGVAVEETAPASAPVVDVKLHIRITHVPFDLLKTPSASLQDLSFQTKLKITIHLFGSVEYYPDISSVIKNSNVMTRTAILISMLSMIIMIVLTVLFPTVMGIIILVSVLGILFLATQKI